jgi:diketogulonate reductase-like aldo/keto reductase
MSSATTPTLPLRTGDALPAVGLGLWKLPQPAVAEHVHRAVAAGYRHFDCACDYGNETQVGAGLASALQAGLCRRDDLWITSKLWNTYHARHHVRQAAERSLRDLQLDVLDLYLIHFPIATAFVPFEVRYPPGWFFDPDAPEPKMHPAKVPLSETWSAMEDLVRAGLVRNIGVCNFNIALLRDLLSYATLPPAVLQVELHPYLAQPKLLRFCREEGIVVTGFSPLGAASYHGIGMAEPHESVLAEPVVQDIAARLGRTPAQVVLRWGVQRGTAVVPMTSNPARLSENLSLFDFELTPDDMAALSALDRHRRFNDPGVFCERAFHAFFPIYE